MIERSIFLRFAGVAAALVFLPLASLAFLAYGLRECGDHCGTPWELFDAWLLAAVYAGLFGVIVGFAAAVLMLPAREALGRGATAFLLLVGIGVAAWPAVWLAPKLYFYVQYLRTPRDQLPIGDPRRTPSDCSKRNLPPDVICGV